MTMTEDVTGFVAAFSLRTAPAELLPRVREAFLDSFGVMLAGSREESAQIAARWIRSERAAGPCAVIAQRDFVLRRQTPRWPTELRHTRSTTIISAIRAR